MRSSPYPLRARARRLVMALLVAAGSLATYGVTGAGAATVNPTGFVAIAGEVNTLTVTDNGTTLTYVDTTAPITASGGCLPAGTSPAGTPVACAENDIVITLGDENDQTTFVGPMDVDVYQFGGAGNDTLRGGAASVNNGMDGQAGADTLAGGPSPNDYADYRPRTAAVTVSTEGAANDGEPAEGDNVLPAVEGVDTGPGNDTITTGGADDAIFSGAGDDSVSGGAGDDFVSGQAGNDTLAGDAGGDTVDGGIGADNLAGGEGDDAVYPGGTDAGGPDGADSVSGGPGLDFTGVAAEGPGPAFAPLAVSVTLDDAPNDGIAGEGDNYRSDIEDVYSAGGGNDTLTGTSGLNILTTESGNDRITGGAGNDILTSNGGTDTIDARDGYSDRVDCGAGPDTAVVDTLDQVSATCETVQAADVGNANDVPEDNPPAVAFVAPAENASIPGRATPVSVNAADDRGVARVVLLDDGRVVGTDTAAPYTFVYSPRGADLGANTLIAMAFDGRNQTATAVRTVRVGKFTPTRVTETVAPPRDRARPFRFRVSGAVRRPATVSAAQGCAAGTVTITVKRGARTVAAQNARLRRTCTYAATVRVTTRGRLTLRARFGGNVVLRARSSAARSVRTG